MHLSILDSNLSGAADKKLPFISISHGKEKMPMVVRRPDTLEELERIARKKLPLHAAKVYAYIPAERFGLGEDTIIDGAFYKEVKDHLVRLVWAESQVKDEVKQEAPATITISKTSERVEVEMSEDLAPTSARETAQGSSVPARTNTTRTNAIYVESHSSAQHEEEETEEQETRHILASFHQLRQPASPRQHASPRHSAVAESSRHLPRHSASPRHRPASPQASPRVRSDVDEPTAAAVFDEPAPIEEHAPVEEHPPIDEPTAPTHVDAPPSANANVNASEDEMELFDRTSFAPRPPVSPVKKSRKLVLSEDEDDDEAVERDVVAPVKKRKIKRGVVSYKESEDEADEADALTRVEEPSTREKEPSTREKEPSTREKEPSTRGKQNLKSSSSSNAASTGRGKTGAKMKVESRTDVEPAPTATQTIKKERVDSSRPESDDSASFLVAISHPHSGKEVRCKVRGRNTIKKVVDGACKGLKLDAHHTQLYLNITYQDDQDEAVTEKYICNKEETVGQAGIREGAKLLLIVDGEEDEDSSEE